MNSAIEPTALPHSQQAAWGSRVPRGHARLCHATSAMLAVLALGFAIAAAVAQPPDIDLVPFALACAFGSLAMLRWGSISERRRAREQGLIDAPTGLYNRHGLGRVGESLLQQARSEGRPLSLLLLDFSDLQEVRNIYGREIARKLETRVIGRMKAIAGAHGLAARTGRTEFTILLAGAGRERAKAVVQRMLGKPSRIEFDAGDSEIVLVPDILCEMAAADIETVDELYGEVAQNLADMRARELRRQLHLQRERIRHSRPMGLPPARL